MLTLEDCNLADEGCMNSPQASRSALIPFPATQVRLLQMHHRFGIGILAR
jgi:hypothetical protein